MGYWGPEPFDNDTAADWVGTEYNDKLLRGALNDGSFQVLRAAAQIVIKLGHHFAFDYAIVDDLIKALSVFKIKDMNARFARVHLRQLKKLRKLAPIELVREWRIDTESEDS